MYLIKTYVYDLNLKINLNSSKYRTYIFTESNEIYTECSRLQIKDMRKTNLVENV